MRRTYVKPRRRRAGLLKSKPLGTVASLFQQSSWPAPVPVNKLQCARRLPSPSRILGLSIAIPHLFSCSGVIAGIGLCGVFECLSPFHLAYAARQPCSVLMHCQVIQLRLPTNIFEEAGIDNAAPSPDLNLRICSHLLRTVC